MVEVRDEVKAEIRVKVRHCKKSVSCGPPGKCMIIYVTVYKSGLPWI